MVPPPDDIAFMNMRDHRLLAAIAAALITAAGVLSVATTGSPSLPPPVTLRGGTPHSIVDDDQGLQLVPGPVLDLEPTTTTAAGVMTADSPDEPTTTPPDGDIDSADAQEQDGPDLGDDERDGDTATSADSLDTPDD